MKTFLNDPNAKGLPLKAYDFCKNENILKQPWNSAYKADLF